MPLLSSDAQAPVPRQAWSKQATRPSARLHWEGGVLGSRVALELKPLELTMKPCGSGCEGERRGAAGDAREYGAVSPVHNQGSSRHGWAP